MRYKNHFPLLILGSVLLILVAASLLSGDLFGYSGRTIHLGGRPNALIAHLMMDGFGTNQYTYISIINLASVPQVVTLKFWDRTGAVLDTTNNTVQTNAQWLVATGSSGSGPAGTRGRNGYLTIEADDVLSLRAEVLITMVNGGSWSAFPVTISSTSISPYGSLSAPAQTEPEPTLTAGTTTLDTTITATPRDTSISTSASFSFTASQEGSTFECKLDTGSFESCTSPKRYTRLSRSLHTVSVRAKDAAGNVDPTPATFTWSII